MLKKFYLLMLGAFLAFSAAADNAPLKKSMPRRKGNSGPMIMVFAGGRPWVGNMLVDTFVKSGARVTPVVGKYLAGLAGASIKKHMGDKVEPTPLDGITPAFKKLKNHKLVVFHLIPQENMKKIFTPAREAALKEYINNGGNVLFTYSTPAGLLQDIMPVLLENSNCKLNSKATANRPAGSNFAFLPETLPAFNSCRDAMPKENAEVLSWIKDENGCEVSPYLARIKIGSGSVSFLNTQSPNPTSIRHFSNWAFCGAFLSAVAAECGNIKLNPQKCIPAYDAVPARVDIAETRVDIAEPVLEITGDTADITVNQREAVFSNGAKLTVKANGSVDVCFPGKETPYISDFQIPAIAFSEIKAATDNLSYEADDMSKVVKAADIKWQFDSISAKDGVATIKYTAKESILEWDFKTGTLDLDGRKYYGIAERARVTKSPLYINEFVFKSLLTLPDPQFSRRFDAYSPPRGYSEFPMDGSVKKSDTWNFGFFGSSQPFELISCKNGVYMTSIEEVQSVSVRQLRTDKDRGIQNNRTMSVGKLKAPAGTVYYWHWFSDGPERGHHEYLAMYQFQRQRFRRQHNLKELPACPIVWYGYQLTDKQKDELIKYAGECGFRFIYPPNPESPITSINSDRNKEIYAKITAAGARAHIWTAGSYVQGNGGWIINNHPEWFSKGPDGKIFAYPGKYYVIDVRNEEFFKWYKEIILDAVAHGVGWVYRDMDAAAGNVINHDAGEYQSALYKQIEYYKFFHDNNCWVSIEGVNPMTIDQYWYRPEKYTSFAGNEFAIVGQVPYGSISGGLQLDYFRTGMYGAFPIFEFAGTTFDFDRIAGEAARGKRAVSFVPEFNRALDFVGMPYIRETDFGTVWYGKGGAVMFFWNPVKKLTLDLPDGWKIRGVEGNVLNDVKGDSIIYIDRK